MKFKRLLSFVLLAAMLTGITTTAFAENDSTSEDITDVTKAVNRMLEYSPEYTNSDFKLGDYVPTYICEGNEFIEDESARRYPVYADGKIVSFYTVMDSGARQFGAEFADELNKVLDSGATEYFLVGQNGKVYVVVNGDATPLIDYGTMNLEPSISTLSSEDFTEETLEEKLATSNTTFNKNDDKENLDVLQDIEVTRLRAGQYRYLKVGTYNQLPDKKICWAVAATRIGNFLGNDYYSPYEAVNYIFGVDSREGNIYDAQDVLSEMYDLSSDYTGSGYSWDEVADCIENGVLMYGAFYDDARTKGHAVCVNGYYINENEGILIMESLGGYYKQLIPNSYGEYEMNYTGLGNLSWKATLTV